MKTACVIGWPIEHSRSPMIHGFWLKKYAIDGDYMKRAVKPEEAAEFFANLAGHGYVGCNVTLPLKELAFAAAQLRDPSAEAVGAANTLWLEDGKLRAQNTDTYGFMAHLSQTHANWATGDGPVLVLGAGGAARAIVYGFVQANVGEVRIANRTRSRAEAIAQQYGPTVKVIDWEERSTAVSDAGVIVNTTTIGMNGEGDLGLDLSQCAKETTVCDIVYVPLETQLLAEARRHGLRTLDGLGMLLHQAVPGFEKWFGVRPEVTQELRDIVVADIEAGQC